MIEWILSLIIWACMCIMLWRLDDIEEALRGLARMLKIKRECTPTGE